MPKDPLKPGRIFWAVYPGGRGNADRRPMVILTRRADLVQTGSVFAVVCSTRFDPEVLLDHEIRLPSQPDGRCVTRLSRDTVAVCDWTVHFAVSDIGDDDTAGMVPGGLLKQICDKVGFPYVPER